MRTATLLFAIGVLAAVVFWCTTRSPLAQDGDRLSRGRVADRRR